MLWASLLNWGRNGSQGRWDRPGMCCVLCPPPPPPPRYVIRAAFDRCLTPPPPGLDSESLYRPELPPPCTGEGVLPQMGGQGVDPSSPTDIALLHPQTGP